MSAANAKAKANANAAKTEELKGLIENLPNTTIQEIFKHVGLDIVAEIPKEYTDKLYGITGNYTFPDYINKIFCAYNYTNIGSDVESNKKLIRNYIKCSTCDYSIAKPHTPPTQDITAALPYNHINLSFDFNDPSNNYFVIGMGMVVDAEVVYTPTEVTKAVNARYSVNFSLRIDATQIIHANDIIKLHLNKYKGWTCNAGIESLMINWDGDVHRATCRVGGSLGNIYEGNFVAPSEPVTCDRNFCTCAADIPLTKTAPL